MSAADVKLSVALVSAMVLTDLTDSMCAVSCHKWIVTKFVMERQSLTVQRQSQDAVNHNSRTVLTFVMEQVAQTETRPAVNQRLLTVSMIAMEMQYETS